MIVDVFISDDTNPMEGCFFGWRKEQKNKKNEVLMMSVPKSEDEHD